MGRSYTNDDSIEMPDLEQELFLTDQGANQGFLII